MALSTKDIVEQIVPEGNWKRVTKRKLNFSHANFKGKFNWRVYENRKEEGVFLTVVDDGVKILSHEIMPDEVKIPTSMCHYRFMYESDGLPRVFVSLIDENFELIAADDIRPCHFFELEGDIMFDDMENTFWFKHDEPQSFDELVEMCDNLGFVRHPDGFMLDEDEGEEVDIDIYLKKL